MKSMRLLTPLTLLLTACSGNLSDDPARDGGTSVDPNVPCTDKQHCCKPVCPNGPDDPDKCYCEDVWECEKMLDPKKCQEPAPVPPGGGDWSCTWTELEYTCTATLPPGSNPPGGGDWSCVQNGDTSTWTCTSYPRNPLNDVKGAGGWGCRIEGKNLVCEKDSPPGGGAWKCTTDSEGNRQCTTDDLPPGGGSWKCAQTSRNGVATWVCIGPSENPDTPPGGGNWTCVKMENELNSWRCEAPVETPPESPPGGGTWQCVQGTEFGGTRCVSVAKPPDDNSCVVGEKKWCDGLQYCGWGQVECDPATKKWKTIKDAKGSVIEDCQELSNGLRPNTVCACYHTYFNPGCCERPDCIIPSGTQGQICPKSAGKLCDYCDLRNPECVGAGSKCVWTNSHETFCGTACSTAQQCPTGYICQSIKSGNQYFKQCVPADLSCYL